MTEAVDPSELPRHPDGSVDFDAIFDGVSLDDLDATPFPSRGLKD